MVRASEKSKLHFSQIFLESLLIERRDRCYENLNYLINKYAPLNE
jgi:hypothetical protein